MKKPPNVNVDFVSFYESIGIALYSLLSQLVEAEDLNPYSGWLLDDDEIKHELSIYQMFAIDFGVSLCLGTGTKEKHSVINTFYATAFNNIDESKTAYISRRLSQYWDSISRGDQLAEVGELVGFTFVDFMDIDSISAFAAATRCFNETVAQVVSRFEAINLVITEVFGQIQIPEMDAEEQGHQPKRAEEQGHQPKRAEEPARHPRPAAEPVQHLEPADDADYLFAEGKELDILYTLAVYTHDTTTVSVLEQSDCDGIDRQYAEILTFCLFTFRQITNIRDKTILQPLASKLLLTEANTEDYLRNKVVVPYSGSPHKGFLSETIYSTVNNTFKFNMKIRGFGLFNQSVTGHAATSITGLLEYYTKKRHNDRQFVRRLASAAVACGEYYLSNKLTLSNQSGVASQIALACFM